MQRAWVSDGNLLELMAAALGMGFAIAGIAGASPRAMATIATIAVSGALLSQGATIGRRWRHASHIAGTEGVDRVGIGSELVGGIAGATLGAVALAGLAPLRLLPGAVIVLGIALLIAGPAEPHLSNDSPRAAAWQVTRDAKRRAGGTMVTAGLAAIVLGILAFVTAAPVLTLCLVSALCIGGALVITSGDPHRAGPRLRWRSSP